jgi:surface carbohydrate biosynthesis protein (TIGR04326 family)
LRYFQEERRDLSDASSMRPRPDHLAINGRHARTALEEGDQSADRFVEVEALRYLYLAERVRHSAKRSADPSCVKLLILGDLTVARTVPLLRLAAAAAQLSPIPLSITFKPHPACPSDMLGDLPRGISEAREAIAEMLDVHDLTLCGNATSAAVDAWFDGMPIAIFLDGQDFNLSPLRDCEGVSFVNTETQLAQTISRAVLHRQQQSPVQDFFFLDEGLERWRALIGKYLPAPVEPMSGSA